MNFSSRIEHFLLYSTKITIYLIPFIPLYIASSLMFPYVTGKNFAFRIMVELAAALWLGLMTINKEYRPQNSIMMTTVLIFTFIVGLADLLGIDAYKSFWSNYERMEGYITILHLSLYFIIIKSIIKTKRDWKILLNIFVIVSVIVSLYAFIETISVQKSSEYVEEYGIRRAGTIGNPTFLASYLLLSIFFGLLLIFNTHKKYLKLVYLVPITLNSIVIYITASRGAILAAVVGTTVIGISALFDKIRNFNRQNVKRVVVPTIIIFLIIIPVFIRFFVNSDLVKNDLTISRFAMMFHSDPSVETRLYIWQMAWNGIKENPVLGWGQENFLGVYAVNPIRKTDKLVWVDRAHNIIIDWLMNAGILGLFSYLAIYCVAFYILWNNFQGKLISKHETLIIITSIVVYFIQNLFTFDTISTYIIFFTLIAYIDNMKFVNGHECLRLQNKISFTAGKIKVLSMSFLAAVAISVFCYYINYIPIKQLQSLSHISMSMSKYKSLPTMLEDFNEALSYASFGDNMIRDQMAAVSKQLLEEKAYEQEGAPVFIQRTLEELEKGIEIERNNLKYLFELFGFYKVLASNIPAFIPLAETLVDRCLRINPEFTRLDVMKADLYFLKKDYEKAFVYLQRTADRYPMNYGVQFNLALASILTSRGDEAEKALEIIRHLKTANNNDTASGIKPVFTIKQLSRLAAASMEVKNYRRALKYYYEILSNLSNYKDIRFRKGDVQPLTIEDKMNVKAKLHLDIADIYMLLGEKENAMKEAKKALEIAPEKISEVAAFID